MTAPVGALEAARTLALGRPEWQEAAACRGLDPELFFPDRGESVAAIKAICAECPVQAECLTYALDHRILHGFWGGKSERERRSLRRNQRLTHLPYCPVCDADLGPNHNCNPSAEAERRRRYPRNTA